MIFEPTLQQDEFERFRVEHDLTAFKSKCDVILANRFTDELSDVRDKVYTRDIYLRD